MARILNVVGAQVRPVKGDPGATLEKFEAEVRTIRRSFPKANLYVFPELYLTGEHPFALGGVLADADLAVEIPGPLTDRLSAAAARARRWIAAGSVVERAGKKMHNTALVFSPTGELVSRYRKVFVWSPWETLTPGREPPAVFEIPRVGKLGLMICYDGSFPEMARSVAMRGAEAIVHPTMTSTVDREQELVMARANAISNQCYVVNVNVSLEFGGGRSIVVDPEGRTMYEAGGGEEFITVVLDLDLVQAVRTHGTMGLNRLLDRVKEAPASVFRHNPG
jgi:formamidase